MKAFVLNPLNKKIEIYSIILTILFYVFRTSFPFFKYPFLLFSISYIIYTILVYKRIILSKFYDFTINYRLIFVLTFILIFFFFVSNKTYLLVFKDVVNLLILLVIFLILSIIITSKKELSNFSQYLIKLIIFAAFLISILRLCESVNIFSLDPYNLKNVNSAEYPFYIDYNFALLPIFYGMIGLFYFLIKSNLSLHKLYYNLLLTYFSLYILLSKSRRGVILLLIILLLLLILKIVPFFKKSELLNKLNLKSNGYLLYLFLISFFLYLIIALTSFHFKNNLFNKIFSREALNVKYNIVSNIHRNISLINKKIPVSTIYDKIWSISFDSRDPDAGGWGSNIHKTIYPLVGKNVEIVPGQSKGYLLDSLTNPNVIWNGNAYSLTQFNYLNVEEGDSVQAAVYCYVSSAFNGTWVLTELVTEKGTIIGSANYDMKNKATWQKLDIKVKCNRDKVFLKIWFSKFGVTNFSSLRGYIILAYPDYKIILKGILAPNLVEHFYNLHKDFNSVVLSACDKIQLTQNMPFSQAINRANYFNFSILTSMTQNRNKKDPDPIRNWFSKIISEDTSYRAYNSNLIVDLASDNFGSDRIERWKFALQIFTKEYNWPQKLFGGGFTFLNWYGYYFLGDKAKTDYPHNPFLYILLYSGIFGLILYVILLYKVFCYYIRYIKEYYLLFIFFLITYFFTFFSGGNPFDPPIMGFFIILPFFIDNIHKNKVETI